MSRDEVRLNWCGPAELVWGDERVRDTVDRFTAPREIADRPMISIASME